MSSAKPDAAEYKARPVHSCLRCAARKVKCDKQRPCSQCVRHDVQCNYKQYTAPPKRHSRAKYDRLNEQLRRYENLLREHGLNPSTEGSTTNDVDGAHAVSSVSSAAADPESSLPTPATTVSSPSLFGSKTQVLQIDGQTRFVDNDLWTRVVEEFDHHEKVSNPSSDEDSRHNHDQETPDMIFGSTAHLQSGVLHLPSQQLHSFWDIFVENVDPMTKIVHVPTVQKALMKASYDIRNVSRTLVALVFAASTTAILSLSDDDCARRFGVAQEALTSQYISATRNALSRADLIGTTSLIVLQAFSLHILALREIDEPPVVWRLTGLAIRIAESMGLHRDGAEIGLPPFETEIRRRIWWNIKVHDYRSAELAGLVKWQHADRVAYIPGVPTNVNDSDLYPGMTNTPTPSEDPTDAIFCVLRSQLATLRLSKISQQQNGWVAIRSNEELKRQEAEVEKAKSEIEMQFLRGLDPSKPLHLVTSLLARTSFNIGTFMMHHPARWSSRDRIPESEKDLLWRVSVSVLVQHDMMTTTPQLRKFTWYTKYHAPWHALIHVLDVLTGVPLHAEAPKVWQLVESLFGNMPELLTNTSRLLYVAVGNLCLKAYEARDVALIQKGRSSGSTPRYILVLQTLRQARRAKVLTRESDIQRRTRSLNLGTDDVTNTQLKKRAMRRGDQDSQDAPLPLSAATIPPSQINNDIDMSNAGSAAAAETDSIFQSADTIMEQLSLPQSFDTKFDESLDQDFNWSQWDSWLGSAQATASEFDLMLADLPG